MVSLFRITMPKIPHIGTAYHLRSSGVADDPAVEIFSGQRCPAGVPETDSRSILPRKTRTPVPYAPDSDNAVPRNATIPCPETHIYRSLWHLHKAARHGKSYCYDHFDNPEIGYHIEIHPTRNKH